MEKVGRGRIIKRGKSLMYRGTIPFKVNERVALLRKDDLDLIIQNSVMALLLTKKRMPKDLFGNEPAFVDQLEYIAPDGKYNLYLDRHFYSPNFKDMIFIRYESVDEAFVEEL